MSSNTQNAKNKIVHVYFHVIVRRWPMRLWFQLFARIHNILKTNTILQLPALITLRSQDLSSLLSLSVQIKTVLVDLNVWHLYNYVGSYKCEKYGRNSQLNKVNKVHQTRKRQVKNWFWLLSFPVDFALQLSFSMLLFEPCLHFASHAIAHSSFMRTKV